MSVITLEPNNTDTIGHQIIELSKIIERSKLNIPEFTLDFGKINFIHPTAILGISSILASQSKDGKKFRFTNVNEGVESYLNTVNFPAGIFPDLDTDWAYKLEKNRTKNYLPIVSFSTERTNDCTNFRNEVLSKVNELIAHKLDLKISEIGHISYFISEFTDNIVEHSGASRGKILVQYYPGKEFLEICILDEGKTILGAYKDSKRFNITTDREALEYALNGKSAKSDERGFGIPTSTNLIMNGLEGKICILSGDAMMTNNKILNASCRWNGTLLSIKIPKKPNKDWMKFI